MKTRKPNYMSTLLSCVAAVGVIATAVLAVKATPKAVELIRETSKENHDGDTNASTPKEKIAASWKCYIPTMAVGATTIAFIFGSNHIGMKHQKALAGACAVIGSAYDKYKNTCKELYGVEAHNEIVNTIVKEKVSGEPLYAYDFGGPMCLDIADSETCDPEVIRTFYDEFSKRYFESTLSRVIQAEYHLNRNYLLGGAEDINEYYDFLGLDGIDGGDELGWSIGDSEIYWIDFNHRITVLDDGMEVVTIEMGYTPTAFDPDDY